MSWAVFVLHNSGINQVVPKNYLRAHEVNEDSSCWCNPQRLEDSPHIFVHNGLDGREKIERGERMVQ